MRQQPLFEKESLMAQDKEARESLTPTEAAKDLNDGRVGSAVSPFGKFSLRETCAHCGREIGASGCVIPDFEELGAICGQECADRRFRIYLKAEA